MRVRRILVLFGYITNRHAVKPAVPAAGIPDQSRLPLRALLRGQRMPPDPTTTCRDSVILIEGTAYPISMMTCAPRN